MLSRAELERAAAVLHERLAGAWIDRIVQRDASTVELTAERTFERGAERIAERGVECGADHVAGDGTPRVARRDAGVPAPLLPSRRRCLVVVSCDPRHAHVGEAESFAAAPPAPLPFAQLLRARLGRSRIESISCASGDRQLEIGLVSGRGAYRLVLQILGPRSNVYLLDGAGAIAGALRPLPETRRDLALGAPLTLPETRPPPAGIDRFASVPGADLLQAIERHYAAEIREARTEGLVRRIGRALTRERQRLARLEAALRRDAAGLRPAEDLRRAGELLKGALHAIPAGAEQVTVRDWETGQDAVIPLDPRLSPAANLEKTFADYQRAKRRERATGERASALTAEQGRLAELRVDFDVIGEGGAVDPDALERFASRPEVARLVARHPLPGEGRRPRAPAAPKRGGPPARLRPGRYRTHDGLEVWVGRSAAGNDHLTTRLARGNDLFLHVEATPGSHVVLRTGGRKDVPQESLLDAAELAVHFSKQRQASRATVHVAPVKDVRKPKGAKPGLVQVLRGRTVSLRRDAARLERVLAARIDDAE